MSLLRKLFGGKEEPPAATQEVMLPGGMQVEVVGESNYQDALAAVAGKKTMERKAFLTQAELVPEPTNPYDPNAVAVKLRGKTVGYLNRSAAKVYRPVAVGLAEKGLRAVCYAKIIGGWDDGEGDVGSYGIWLDIGTPDQIMQAIRER